MSGDRSAVAGARLLTVVPQLSQDAPGAAHRLPSVVRAEWQAWVRRLRGGRGERGMVTAEIATALPALVVIAAGLLFVIGAVGAQLRCGDLSREAARQLARGQDEATVSREVLVGAPPDAQLRVSRAGGLVTASITAHAPTPGALARLGSLVVSGSATALDETTIGVTP